MEPFSKCKKQEKPCWNLNNAHFTRTVYDDSKNNLFLRGTAESQVTAELQKERKWKSGNELTKAQLFVCCRCYIIPNLSASIQNEFPKYMQPPGLPNSKHVAVSNFLCGMNCINYLSYMEGIQSGYAS